MGDGHEVASINTLLIASVVATNILFAYVVKRRNFHYITESAASVGVGCVIGLVARLIHPSEGELSHLRFDSNTFFFLLLPPIIFESGFALKRKRFFRNLTTIVLYAVVGTLISTFAIGLPLYYLAKAGWISHLDTADPLQALLFGALISAVDPVATLSVMGRADLNCEPLLYSLVFGESVLNDAVSIVLFDSFSGLASSDSESLKDPMTYLRMTGQFLGVSAGSVVLGTVVGLLATFICKHLHLRVYPEKEVGLLMVTAYLAYGAGEAIKLSGIMSLFFCGVVLAHYNWHNLSPRSQETSFYVFKSLAMASESLVFAYLGMSVFSGQYRHWNVKFIGYAFLFCLVGRALNTFPLSWLANCRRKRKIPIKMQVVMWFAGLRGAIAFALALSMPQKDGDVVWNNDVIVTTTLSIVLFTTIVCGGMTSPLLKATGMRRLPGRGRFDSMDSAPAGGFNRPEPRSGLHRWWKSIDNRIMKPLFRLGASAPEDKPDDEFDFFRSGGDYVPDGVADEIVEHGGQLPPETPRLSPSAGPNEETSLLAGREPPALDIMAASLASSSSSSKPNARHAATLELQPGDSRPLLK